MAEALQVNFSRIDSCVRQAAYEEAEWMTFVYLVGSIASNKEKGRILV